MSCNIGPVRSYDLWGSALLVVFALLFLIICTFHVSAQAPLRVSATADTRFSEIGPVSSQPDGTFVGLAKAKDGTNGGSTWVTIAIERSGSIRTVGKLRSLTTAAEQSLVIAGSVQLDDGGMIVVGSAAGDERQSTLRAGWAARMDAKGGILWSGVYDDDVEVGAMETFGFALKVGKSSVLLGGTTSLGESCTDGAYGVTLTVDLNDGKPLGRREKYAGKARQGLFQAVISSSGEIVLGGWQAELQRSGNGCLSRPWLASIDAAGKIVSKREWRGSAGLVPNRLVSDEQNGVAIYARSFAGESSGGDAGIPVVIRTRADRRFRISDIETGDISIEQRTREILPFGATLYSLIENGFDDHIGAQVVDQVGRCIIDVSVASLGARDLRISGSAGMGVGNAILFGTLAVGDGRGVWVASIMPQEPQPHRHAISAKDEISWLVRVPRGRTAIQLDVPGELNVVIAARQIEGDVDLHLLSSDGAVLGLSDNIGTAAERLSLPLGAGTYELAIVSSSSENALVQISVSAEPKGRDETLLSTLAAAENAGASAVALDRLGYRGVSNDVVRSNAFGPFAVSQCRKLTPKIERQLFIAAARRDARQAHLMEREAEGLKRPGTEMPAFIKSGEASTRAGRAAVLTGKDHRSGDALVQLSLNHDERVLTRMSSKVLASVGSSDASDASGAVQVDKLAGTVVWTNADGTRLLTVLDGSHQYVFGSIETTDGRVFQGLLGSMVLINGDFQRDVRISSVHGRRIEPSGHVIVSDGGQGQAIQWSSALWTDAQEIAEHARGETLAWPIAGLETIARHFGEVDGEKGNGVEFEVKATQKVIASHYGTVLYTGSHYSVLGAVILIEGDDGLTTIYGQVDRSTVAMGEKVRRGQAIAFVGEKKGSEPARLYFEARLGLRPLDPHRLFKKSSATPTQPKEKAPQGDGKSSRPSELEADRDPQGESTRDANPPEVAASSGDDAGWTGRYIVVRGDSLFAIARKHAVSLAELERVNKITNPRNVLPGTVLKVPSSRDIPSARSAPTIINAPSPEPRLSDRRVAPLGGERPDTFPKPSSVAPPVRATKESASGPDRIGKFRWPARGKIISGFGDRMGGNRNDGINISVPRGTEVHAAESGVVTYAGDGVEGYGNLVLIRHPEGWITAYAHNDALIVKPGEKVRRGQVIAKAGSTGSVTQPQLHFEIRQGTKPVDPLSHLEH